MKAVIRRFKVEDTSVNSNKAYVKKVIKIDKDEFEYVTNDIFQLLVNYRRYDGSDPHYIDTDVVYQP